MAIAKRPPLRAMTSAQMAEMEARQKVELAAHLEREEAGRVKRNAKQAFVMRDLVTASLNRYDVALFDGRHDEPDRRTPETPPTTTWDENHSPGRAYIICGRTVGIRIDIPDDTIRAAVRRLADKIFGVSPVVIKGKDYSGRTTTLLYRADGKELIISQGKDFPSWNYLPIEVFGAGRMIAVSDTSQGGDAQQIQYESLTPFAVPRIHGVPGECTMTPIPPPGSAKWSDLPSISEATLAEFMAAAPGVMPPGAHVARVRNLPRLDEYMPPATLATVADILRADGGIPIDGHSPYRYVHGVGVQVWAATAGDGFTQWAAWFVRAGKAIEGWGAGFDKFPRDQMERLWGDMKKEADKIGVLSLFNEASLRGCRLSAAMAGDGGLSFYDPDADTGPEAPWLVQRLIGQGTHGLIVGAPGHGKSFLAVDIGYHIALGLPWQGRAVTQGTVLYFTAEGTASIAQRMKAFRKVHGVAVKGVPFQLVPMEGVNLADDSGGAERIIEAIRRAEKKYGQPVALVFIDTVAASLGTCDENGAGMQAYVANVGKIKAQTGVTVQSIHHPAKAGDGREPRGHGSLKGTADASLVVRMTPSGRRTIFVDKLRDGERGEVIDFHIESVGLGDDANGAPVTSAVVRPGHGGAAKVRGHGQPEGEKVQAMPKGARLALACLATAPEATNHSVPADMLPDGARVVTKAAWQTAATDPTKSADSERRAHGKNVKALIERGAVTVHGGFVWAN